MIEFDYGSGVAAVVRQGGVWAVTPDRGRAGPYPLQPDQLDEVGLPDGRWVVAGHLPATAARAVAVEPSGAQVEAAVGDGVFVVVGGRMVRFENERGEVVPVRHVAGSPVEDAETDCPLCGERSWVLMEGDEIACARCGFGLQSSMVFAYAEEADGDPEAEAAWRREQEAETRGVLERLTLPVLALDMAGPRPKLAGWGGNERGTTSVTVQHAGVDIRVERRDGFAFDLRHDLREALEGALRRQEEAWPDVSPAALHLWLVQLEREAARDAALAAESHARVKIDGAPADALRLVGARGWALALDRGDLRIFLTSREPSSDVALRTVADPAAELELVL